MTNRILEPGEFMSVTETTHAQELIALEEQFGAHNYHPLDVVIERAEGVWV